MTKRMELKTYRKHQRAQKRQESFGIGVGEYMEGQCMAKDEIFRVSVFGGFNKEDVKEYILSLESEIESLKMLHQKEKNEFLQKLSATEERGDTEDMLQKLRHELEEKDARIKSMKDALQQTAQASVPADREEFERCLKEKEESFRTREEKWKTEIADLEKTYQRLLSEERKEKEALRKQMEAYEKQGVKQNAAAEDERIKLLEEAKNQAEAEKEAALKSLEEAKNQAEAEKEAALKSLEEAKNQAEAERDAALKSLEEAKNQAEAERDAALKAFAEYRNRNADREETVRKLEEYKQKAASEKRDLENQVALLQAQKLDAEAKITQMKEEQERSFMDYQTISKVLEDANRSAKLIKEEARQEKERLLREAHLQIEKEKSEVVSKVNAELENKGIQLVAAKYKIEQYTKEVKRIQENMYQLTNRMENMVNHMPARLDDYWKGEHYEKLEEQLEGKKEDRLPDFDEEE